MNVEFPKYIILGACNPPLAHNALQAEKEIGLFLPCNIIVYEKEGKAFIAVFDPMVITKIIENADILAVAEEMNIRLERVIAAV